MNYLSIDLEATGLKEDCLIIEFAAIPFSLSPERLSKELSFHSYVHCPSFESLKRDLDPWVVEHNEGLIRKAHKDGLPMAEFKKQFTDYLESKEIREFYKNAKIILFGKSLNAIDLPFLNRDLGFDFMRTYFHHQVQDLSSVAYSLIDMGRLPEKCKSGSELSKHLGFGEVDHTALEDAINTALMYIELIKQNADNEKEWS